MPGLLLVSRSPPDADIVQHGFGTQDRAVNPSCAAGSVGPQCLCYHSETFHVALGAQ